jgi:diacylglycerol O-acyltransferase
MEQLSALDTAFIYLEKPNSPMHVGGVYIFDKETPTGTYNYEKFKQHMAARLHVSKVFRRRLVELPLDLDRPYWVEDPHFDLQMHLPHVGLPEPGGWSALMDLAADIFSRPLDRSRPLWESTFVDGLDGFEGLPSHCWAMITKVHHAAIDGISGEEILMALMDVSPSPRIEPITTAWKPEPIPGGLTLIRKNAQQLALSPVKTARFLKTGTADLWQSIKERTFGPMLQPPRMLSAPDTLIDGPICSRRSFNGAQLSLERIKAVKNILPGTTVNDVILTLCGGVVKRYLEESAALPSDSLVTMAPISLRGLDDNHSGGNKVSGMLINLATDIDDPFERLRAIHRNASRSKQYHQAVPVENLLDNLPNTGFALATRLYNQLHLFEKHRPIANFITTNIPGPQIPIYYDGAELVSQFGTAPIYDNLGLMFVVMSYDGTVGIGATSCRSLIPHMHQLTDLFPQELDSLEKAALGHSGD